MERQIYDLETEYVTETEWGNALAGWGHLEGATSIVRRPTARGSGSSSTEVVRRQFSLSSVTSPAAVAERVEARRRAQQQASAASSGGGGADAMGAGAAAGAGAGSSIPDAYEFADPENILDKLD